MTNNKLLLLMNCRFAMTMTFILCLGLTLNAQTYCQSKANLPWTEWIAGVKIGTIDNASSKEGYGNFTTLTTNLTQGATYPLSITQGFSWAPDPNNATQQGRVWIDYNKNGTFETTELVASFTRTSTTANVTIPATASTGATRMRVSFKTIGAPTACEVFDKGEVEDYTVNIQSGTVQSCANNALNFDGTNDQVVTSRPVIPANADFTLEATCISTATSTDCVGEFRRLFVFDLNTASSRFELGECAGQLTLYLEYFGLSNGLFIIPNTSTIRDGNWHHVSAVKQGTNLIIYYDGVSVFTQPNVSRINLAARQLIVGNWINPIEGWQGNIDEVKVWNYAMTATEVQNKRLCEPTGTESNLLLYYPFNQGTSSGNNAAVTTALDKSLSANNGIINNLALTGTTSNFVCSNLALTTCNAVPLPDLALDYYRFGGYTVDRTTTSYETAVTNRGTAASPIADFKVYISRDSVYPSGNLYLNGNVAGIAAGSVYQSSGSTLLLDTFQAGIKYYTIAVVDPLNLIAETNEANNVYISTGTIYKPAVVNNSCRYQDSLQLVSLYNAAGGANWVRVWNLNTPINTWSGVTLNANGCVIDINEGFQNMVGTLPNLNLPNLQKLTLTYSALLGGSIPNLSLPSLQELNLSGNAFTGAIPNFNLPNLTALFLTSNKLTSVPSFTLPKLQYLFISGNQLTGAIPNFNLPNLQALLLTGNGFSGSIPNFSLPNLIYIELISSGVSGTIPNFKLPKLAGLLLQNNQLTGSIPDFTGTPLLSDLALNGNNLSGCLPFALKVIPTRVTNGVQGSVKIFNNPLLATQDFAAFLANNTGACDVVNPCRNQDSLQLVRLYNAAGGANWTNKWNLATPINTWYGVVTNPEGCVTSLDLSYNNLVGTIPNLSLSKLAYLYLFNNQLTGSIPNFIMPALNNLQLNNNQLTGAIPSFDSLDLPNLQKIYLYNNQLSGTLPNFNFSYLGFLSLRNNKLTGTIPNLNLPNLIFLNLGNNLFTGNLPDLTLPRAQNVYLNNNNLSGCIPASMKAFCGKTMDFSFNPGLQNQDFAGTFCLNNVGSCSNTSASAISLSLTSTPSVYRIYTPHNFKVTAVNNGTSAFTNVKIKFTRPTNTVAGGTKVTSIGTFQDYCPGSIECAEWTIPTLAAGATATLDAPTFILAPTGGITATATLLSSTPTIATTITATITVNSATAPTTQSLAFQVPTQQVPVVIQRIAPNPTEGDVIVKLDSWKEQEVDFNFSDITGKTIHSEKRQLEKGVNRVQFDLYSLPQGVYFIQTNVGKGTNVPTKFVKM